MSATEPAYALHATLNQTQGPAALTAGAAGPHGNTACTTLNTFPAANTWEEDGLHVNVSTRGS